METVKLCTCNNCGNIYEDKNSTEESIDYSAGLIPLFEIEELPTILLDDGDISYGCPICHTDGYLQDNVNPAGGKSTEFMLQYMSDTSNVDYDEVVEYIISKQADRDRKEYHRK